MRYLIQLLSNTEIMMKLENFPIPEELQLFIDDDLAEEIDEVDGLRFNKSTVRVWSLKGTRFLYFMSGVRPKKSDDEIFIEAVISNWTTEDTVLVTATDILDEITDYDLTRVLVSRPDVYFGDRAGLNRLTKGRKDIEV